MVVVTSFSPPTEGVKHVQPSTKLIVNERDVGLGTLYIAESELSWKNNSSGEGFALLYPHIAVHALSRDTARFGHECLYIMVDVSLDEVMGDMLAPNQDVNDEEDDDSNDEGTAMSELRFVPEDKGALDALYHAMSVCQSLNPDPQDQLSLEEEDDDEEYLDADGEEVDDPHAAGDSGYIEDHVNGFRNGEEDMDTDGQFEDAEEED